MYKRQTYDYGISQIGDNIFQMKTDYILQGRYAANYAFNQLNAKTVGILSPNDKLGIQITDGFLIEADLLGMDIISIEWYSGIPTDISVGIPEYHSIEIISIPRRSASIKKPSVICMPNLSLGDKIPTVFALS